MKWKKGSFIFFYMLNEILRERLKYGAGDWFDPPPGLIGLSGGCKKTAYFSLGMHPCQQICNDKKSPCCIQKLFESQGPYKFSAAFFSKSVPQTKTDLMWPWCGRITKFGWKGRVTLWGWSKMRRCCHFCSGIWILANTPVVREIWMIMIYLVSFFLPLFQSNVTK